MWPSYCQHRILAFHVRCITIIGFLFRLLFGNPLPALNYSSEFAVQVKHKLSTNMTFIEFLTAFSRSSQRTQYITIQVCSTDGCNNGQTPNYIEVSGLACSLHTCKEHTCIFILTSLLAYLRCEASY